MAFFPTRAQLQAVPDLFFPTSAALQGYSSFFSPPTSNNQSAAGSLQTQMRPTCLRKASFDRIAYPGCSRGKCRLHHEHVEKFASAWCQHCLMHPAGASLLRFYFPPCHSQDGTSTKGCQVPRIFYHSKHQVLVKKCSLDYDKHINLDVAEIKMLLSLLGLFWWCACV